MEKSRRPLSHETSLMVPRGTMRVFQEFRRSQATGRGSTVGAWVQHIEHRCKRVETEHSHAGGRHGVVSNMWNSEDCSQAGQILIGGLDLVAMAGRYPRCAKREETGGD